MAPIVDMLAQSDSKARFFERLGLSTNKSEDTRTYALMKTEAAEGRKRLVEKHDVDETISETAIHGEVLNIYSRACKETKPIYDLGRDINGVAEENWVIRWLLWHAFRYRDGRNNRNRNRQTARTDGEGKELSATPESSAEPSTINSLEAQSTAGDNTRSGPSQYWDPVRNL